MAAIDRVRACALRADLAAALEEAGSIERGALQTDDRVWLERFCTRFEAEVPPACAEITDALCRQLVSAYRAYWHDALREPGAEAAARLELSRRLAGELDRPELAAATPDALDFERLESALLARVEAAGHHALFGRTLPLRELMIWTTETRRPVRCALPEDEIVVDLIEMSGFVCLGWAAYATLDRLYTGGWVATDGLRCVRPAWPDLDDERFRVGFVAHEAQHHSDRARFGTLPQCDLEYRAKLAELALAESASLATRERFATSREAARSAPGADNPHQAAEWWLVERLESALGGALGAADVDAVRAAAATLLRASTRAILEQGRAIPVF